MTGQIIRHGTTASTQYHHKLEQYSLVLRGNNINSIIDAATPLLGMILRIQDLTTPIIDTDYLYRQIVTDIQTIEQQLELKNYEPGSIITFRYVLCSFIDETVMSSEPTLARFWSKKSLLIHFHNEGWGGERVFEITERLMNEPKRYKDMLEFIYLCFGLGFRGRYKVQNPNSDDFERLFRRLNSLLQSLNGEPAATYLYIGEIQTSHYQLPKEITKGHVLFFTSALVITAYFIYLLILNVQSAKILEQLNLLLK